MLTRMSSGVDATHDLAGLSLFVDCSPAELEQVGQAFEEQWFEAGERAQRQGFVGTSFYVILEGEAEWRVDNKPVDRTATSLIGTRQLTLRRGDYFGELTILFDEPAISDVIAIRPMRTIGLPGQDLESFLIAHPKIMFRLLQGEARRLRDPLRWQT
jgi:CRP-like cAMP-binding protein